MKKKSLTMLALSAALIAPINAIAGEKHVSRVNLEEMNRPITVEQYNIDENIKTGSFTQNLGSQISDLSYDTEFQRPFRSLPRSDDIPPFENFVNTTGKILENDFFRYRLTDYEVEDALFDQRREQFSEELERKIQFERLMWDSLGDVIGGYRVTRKITGEIKDKTSVRKTIGETKLTVGIRYDNDNVFSPLLNIKNARIPRYLVPNWVNNNVLDLEKIQIDQIRVYLKPDRQKIEFNNKSSFFKSKIYTSFGFEINQSGGSPYRYDNDADTNKKKAYIISFRAKGKF